MASNQRCRWCGYCLDEDGDPDCGRIHCELQGARHRIADLEAKLAHKDKAIDKVSTY